MLELPNPWQVAVRTIGPIGREVAMTAARGRIDAAFGAAFYVTTDVGMFCVGHEGMYDGPLNVVTDAPSTTDWQASGLRPGQGVALSTERLRVGPSLVLDISGAAGWMPAKSPAFRPRPNMAQALASLPTWSDLPTAAHRPMRNLERDLADAFRFGRLFRPDPADLAALSGMGIGLTPAGDDVLGGVMIACHAVGAPEFADDLWRLLEPLAIHNGNAISTAHLKAAALGMGAADLHVLMNDLLAGAPIGADHHRAISRIGHTSGRDALAGMALVLRAKIASRSQLSAGSGVA